MSNPETIKMPFGKHKGKTLSQILQDEPAYLDYLTSITIQSKTLDEAVAAMNKKYAAEIERALDE